MDWRYNTIWYDQIDPTKLFFQNFKETPKKIASLERLEYAIIWYCKNKDHSLNPLPFSNSLLFLELNWANTLNLVGIGKFNNLKRLELHYCTKLENDRGISEISNTLEFLHINQSKKYIPSEELYSLKKLKVLCLNVCGNLKNLHFLNQFPELIDFRFVDTNILDGDLSPILEHPSIRTVGFLDKRHYNLKRSQVDNQLALKSNIPFKDEVHKGQYMTYKYKRIGNL